MTNISFDLTKPADIKLKVFTAEGKEIAELANGHWSEGSHTIPFDVTPLGAGIYFYQLAINGEAITRELIVTK
jgi:hypothetical protein